MSKKTTKTVRGLLTKLSSERTPYKPYGYELDFSRDLPSEIAQHIFVEFEIPEDVIIQDEGNVLVINLTGLNAMLQVTADSVDKLDKEHMKKLQEG